MAETMTRDLRRIVVSAPAPAESAEAYWRGYFWRKAHSHSPLKPLGKPCHDCAVVCEFYSEFSDRLAEQPEPVRTQASLRWFCHNHPDRACRGNIDRIAAAKEGK